MDTLIMSKLAEINHNVCSSRIAVFVRFSHIAETQHPFKEGKGKSLSERANLILSEERLIERFRLFEKICLPSFDYQTDKQFSLILRCSTLLPKRWVDRLIQLAGERDYMYLNFLHPAQHIMSAERDVLHKLFTPEKGPVITARIDDDDGVSADYVSRLRAYLKHSFVGYGISFAKGYYIQELDGMYRIPKVRHINNSCGLALVSGRYMLNKFIVNLPVNHLHLDTYTPTVVDSCAPAILMSAHSNQDTNRSSNSAFDKTPWLTLDEAKLELKKCFPFVTSW